MYLNKHARIMLTSAIFLFILSGIFHYVDVHVPTLPIRLSAISYLGHFTLCTLYLIYNRRNIIQPEVKYYITFSVICLYGWFIIELLEEVIFPVNHPGNRVLWYMYYIPTLMIPNLLLMATLNFNLHATERIQPGWGITFAVTFVLIILVMTNDMHNLAFTFPDGTENFHISYRYNYVYFISMTWMFGLFFGCGLIMWQKARTRQNRHYIWIVYISLGISVMYFIWWLLGRPIFPNFDDAYGVAEIFEAHILLTTELCIRVGLISSNFNAIELFNASELSVSLVDADGHVRYKTANQVPITPEEMQESLTHDVYIDSNHRLHGQPVSGGNAFWVNDLSSVNQVADRLRSVQIKLEEDNNLIAAENDMIARRSKADEQNRLYTMLAQNIEPQLDSMARILHDLTPESPDLKEKLALASIYKVYIKRYSNLILLKQNSQFLNAFELENSIRESLDYIGLNGVACGYSSQAKGDFDADMLLKTYAYFQDIVEANIGTMKTLTVELITGPESINLKMHVDRRVFDKEIITEGVMAS